jgi:predicted DNA-binding ribbon-helix-helix protein
MAAQTTTIRVTRETHDRLARQARRDGVSLAELMKEISIQREEEAACRSERQAAVVDAENPEVAAEEHLWGAVATDGLD